jgi:hypothetical protein
VPLGIPEQLDRAASHGLDRADRFENPVDPVVDYLRESPGAACHHWRAAGHGLERRQAKRLGLRRQNEQIATLEQRSDGVEPAEPRELDGLTGDEVRAYVESLSTRARLVQFAYDFRRHAAVDFAFRRRDDGAVVLRLADAMEFLTHKDYVDNWLSESHERFCALEYEDWRQLLQAAGLRAPLGERFYILDSKPVPVCKPIRHGRVRLLREEGAYFGKSSTGWFFGFKLHALVHQSGAILAALLLMLVLA